MLVLAALLGLAALGQTLVLILGGIDLSVPGHIVMGAILVSQLYGTHGWARAGHCPSRSSARRCSAGPPAGSAIAGASSR